MKNRIVLNSVKGLVAALCLGAVGVGVVQAVQPAGRPCFRNIFCLDVWAPVICPDGNVYSNSCYAYRACQSNCTPTGGGGGPI